MDVEGLAAFVAVVEAGGFGAAARARRIPKSSLSRRVAALEARLGTELLRRNTRRIQLTEAGAALFERCREPIAELESAEADARSAGAVVVPAGQLRITATGAFGRAVLAPVVADYIGANPGVRIELVLLDRRVNLIEEGFDLAIRIGSLDDAVGLSTRRLGVIERVLCASAAFVARHGQPECVEDLQRFNLLLSSAGQNPWRFAGAEPIRLPRPNLVANDIEVLRDVALAGRGLAVLPRFLVMDDLIAGRLVELLPSSPPASSPVAAVWPGARPATPAVRAFNSLVTARFAQLSRAGSGE